MKPLSRLVLALCAALFFPTAATAQTHSWVGGSDNWNDAPNWNVGSIPNDPAHWALIGQTGPLQVTLDINVTLDRLDLTGQDAILFTNGRNLNVLSNMGIGTPMGTGNTSVLRLASSSFSGGGQMTNWSTVVSWGGSSIENLYNEGLLQVAADGTYGNSSLTLSGSPYNADRIDLLSVGGAYASTLTIASGSQLDNGGTITTLTEAGGTRSINGSLLNRGFVNIGQPTSFSTGPFIQDQNRMHILGANSLTVNNNVTFQMDGGELRVDGSMLQTNGDFIWNAGEITNNKPVLAASDLQIDFSNLDNGGLRMIGSGTVDGIWRAGKILELYGDNTYGNNTTTWLGTGDQINQGQIWMSSPTGSFSVTQNISTGLRFVNQGQINTEAGAGGARVLKGNYLNDLGGSMTFATNTNLQVGPFENKGSIAPISGAQMLFNNNILFTQTDGTLDVSDGDYFHPNGTAQFHGGTTVGTLRFAATDLEFGAGFTSAFDAETYGTATMTGDLKAGQTLRLLGNTTSGNAVLTLTQATTNAGTMIQSVPANSYSTTLNDGGNGLTNTGTMRFEAGTGGLRLLNANFINDGNVEVRGPLQLGAGSYTNRASWTVDPGASVVFTNNRSFTQEAGTLQIDGSWFHPNGDASFTGGAITGVPVFASTDLSFGAGFTSPFDARTQGTASWTGDLKPMQKLTIEGQGTYGNATLNTTGNANAGEIEMTSQAASYSVRLGTTNQTLDNSGVLRTSPGTGGPRFLRGDLSNSGTIDADAPTTFEDGPILNSGTIEVDAAAHLGFNNNMTFEQSAGLLQIDGSFEHQSGTARLLGGAITGTPLYSSMQLELGAGYTSALDANLRGTSTLTGDVKAGQTLHVRGDGTYGNGALNLAGTTSVEGEIELTALNASYSVQVGSTNVALNNQGTLRISPGSGGPRTLRGDITNSGLIQVDHPLSFQDGPIIQNGTLNVSTGDSVTFGNNMTFEMNSGVMNLDGSFEIPSGTTRMLGGTVNGVPLISSGALELDPGFTSGYEANLRGTVTLTGEVGSDHLLRVRGDGVYGNGTLNVPAPITNHGTIELTAQTSSYATILNASAGNEVSNLGTLRTLAGSGGTRALNTQLENDGLVEIQGTTTLGRSGAQHQNRGTMKVQAGLSMTGTSFTNVNGARLENSSTITNTQFNIVNEGTWAIGDAIGTSTITGDYIQTVDGRAVIKIGGLTPDTEHDQMVVGGVAQLDGRLRIQLVNGFEPKFGDQFVILTAGSTSSNGFEGLSVDGDVPLGYGFEVVDTGSSIIAQVVQKVQGVNPDEVPLTLSDPSPGIAGQVNTFQVSGAAGGGQIVIVYGIATGSTPSGVCSGVDFGIDAAQQVGTGFASAQGNALVSANVPASASGITAYFQALDLTRCELTPVNSFDFP
ncbi:MAG: hypothetical protein CMJ94_06310 [Planctomycetes bacterium]|nr:hypothetical protein [Planctomycetota bacterium]